MQKTIIKNIETGISKNCDILNKNATVLEIVIEDTTIKITLMKSPAINILLSFCCFPVIFKYIAPGPHIELKNCAAKSIDKASFAKT